MPLVSSPSHTVPQYFTYSLLESMWIMRFYVCCFRLKCSCFPIFKKHFFFSAVHSVLQYFGDISEKMYQGFLAQLIDCFCDPSRVTAYLRIKMRLLKLPYLKYPDNCFGILLCLSCDLYSIKSKALPASLFVFEKIFLVVS